jgi:hypothetical protein
MNELLNKSSNEAIKNFEQEGVFFYDSCKENILSLKDISYSNQQKINWEGK